MYWLRRLFRKQQTERQLDSELRFHLEQRAAELVASGMSPDEAPRRARLEFGGVEGIKEECRESRRVHFLEVLLQDIKYGVRTMRRSPGFTVVAVVTLALGIGANTAMFSIVNGVLLNPLPYPQPEQLVALHESKPNFQNGSISFPNFLDWQRENRSFSSMAAARTYSFNLTGRGEAQQVRGLFISSEFFRTLGVNPVMGRTLAAGEDAIGGPPVALIHAGLWERKFGSDPEILGKSINLDGKSYAIVGVIPASFGLSNTSFRVSDVFLPIGQWNNPLLPHRSAGLGIHGIGRLKPGVSLEQARADMDRLARNLAAAYPDVNKGIGASLVPLRHQLLGRVEPFLIVLVAAVGFVLLIACVNVANLLLARATGREREFAIRASLGAGTARIVRQLLTESILLAAVGGALGLGLALWGQRAMSGALTTALPRAAEVRVDTRVLLFTILVSLLSGVVFGLAPALKTSRLDVLARTKEGGRNVSRTHRRTQNTFVVTEIAMALVLLIGAGLMIRSLTRLWRVDPGFSPHNVLTLSVSLSPSMAHATPHAVRAAFREIDDKLVSVPGVQAESLSWGAFPLQSDDEELFWMEGQPKPSSIHDMNWTLRYVVGPDYLKSMGILLVRGRFLSSSDDEHAPLVVVIDESFAAKFFPGQDPIGKRINLDDGNDHSHLAQIVGLVKHVKQWGLDSDDKQSLQAQMYSPFMQLPDPAMMLSTSGTGIVVRSNLESAGLFDSIRSALRQINSEQVVYAPESMDQIIADTLATRRYAMILLGGFALLALVLASVGIYGVVSYLVGQRTQEIGIRMALGARRMHVLGMIIGHGTRLILIGLAVGVAAALGLTRLMASLLFDVSTTDPLTFAGVAALLTLVALSACYVPARRAARVNPMVALRCE